MQTLLSAFELTELNARLEAAHPEEIIRWTLEESGLARVAVASSFQAEGTVVIHLATKTRPDIPILFLDTGFNFAETLAFKQQLAERFSLNVVDLAGDYTVERQETVFGERLYEGDPEKCCDINKVRPMYRALRELDAWMTAFRRDSSPTRADAPIVDQYELEPGKMMVRVNPVATWSRRDVWQYLKAHDLPHNPLYDLGYTSIGCAPCTRMRFACEPVVEAPDTLEGGG